MRKYRVGILRVLTVDDRQQLLTHQRILEKYFPEFDMETKCIPNQYKGLYNKKASEESLPIIIEMAKEWEKELDGLIISCADDPGVAHLQQVLTIPVIGAGASSACLSMNISNKIGIIGIQKELPIIFKNILGDMIVGYELPTGVTNTNDLQTDWGKDAILESVMKLKNLDAKLIVFSCTGVSTTGVHKFIRELGMDVVDSIVAEGIAMKGLLINKDFNK